VARNSSSSGRAARTNKGRGAARTGGGRTSRTSGGHAARGGGASRTGGTTGGGTTGAREPSRSGGARTRSAERGRTAETGGTGEGQGRGGTRTPKARRKSNPATVSPAYGEENPPPAEEEEEDTQEQEEEETSNPSEEAEDEGGAGEEDGTDYEESGAETGTDYAASEEDRSVSFEADVVYRAGTVAWGLFEMRRNDFASIVEDVHSAHIVMHSKSKQVVTRHMAATTTEGILVFMTKGSAAITIVHNLITDRDGLIVGAVGNVKEDGSIGYTKIPNAAWGRKNAKVPDWETFEVGVENGLNLLPTPAGGPGEAERITVPYAGYIPAGLAHSVMAQDVKTVGELYTMIWNLAEEFMPSREQRRELDVLFNWFRMAATMDRHGNSLLAVDLARLEWGSNMGRDRKLCAALVGAFDFGTGPLGNETTPMANRTAAKKTGHTEAEGGEGGELDPRALF